MPMTNEEKFAALEGRIGTLLTEKSRLSRDLKKAQEKSSLTRALVEELQALVSPLEEFERAHDPKRFAKSDGVTEHLVMHLSDEHADEVVKKHQVGNTEEFDFPIALCRAEKYVDTVIKFSQQTLSNYKFPVLHILSYGDHTNGEIHNGEGHSYYKNMMRNVLAIGQMQALMIRDLAPFFPIINVVCLPGNHGRRTPKKNFNGPWDNWDYMVSEIAATYCRGLKNVNFAIPECFSLNYEINGHGFHIQHGDDIKSWNSIPWYGIERKTRRLVSMHNSLGIKSRYFVLGHFHAFASMADLSGETFINGAWCATTPYSYESFSSFREPMQLLHGVHPQQGVSWRLPVRLRDPEKEAKGPERYKVILANEAFG